MTHGRSGTSLAVALAGLALAACTLVPSGCRRAKAPPETLKKPSVRLYFISTLAGALEPCGCRKDMLGGVDHAAALLAAKAPEAPEHLLLAAGALMFSDPELPRDRRDQDLWKAESLAASLADAGLDAWTPGANDFAAGPQVFTQLTSLAKAPVLAANLQGDRQAFAPTALFQAGKYRVGVTGIADLPGSVGVARDAREPATVLAAAHQSLTAQGAQIQVALISASRGEGLRLAEKVPGFEVIALGKSLEQGEANDAAFPPTLVNGTLVLQAPNHLQALSVVDLFVVGEDFSFADDTGIEKAERRASLSSQIAELERRLAALRAQAGASPESVTATEKELARRRDELARLGPAGERKGPPQQSSFRYDLIEVREKAGSKSQVAARMGDYYRRVNEHNRELFKDREPARVAAGQSAFVGGESCKSCHENADAFWRNSQHARAYETLTREFKEFNLECVGCHVTGYNRPGGSTVTHVDKLKDVQCEACHGPGSRHVESGGSSELITLTPAESVCRGCHHTPHVADDWDVRASWTQIVGPGHGLPLP